MLLQSWPLLIHIHITLGLKCCTHLLVAYDFQWLPFITNVLWAVDSAITKTEVTSLMLYKICLGNNVTGIDGGWDVFNLNLSCPSNWLRGNTMLINVPISLFPHLYIPSQVHRWSKSGIYIPSMYSASLNIVHSLLEFVCGMKGIRGVGMRPAAQILTGILSPFTFEAEGLRRCDHLSAYSSSSP